MGKHIYAIFIEILSRPFYHNSYKTYNFIILVYCQRKKFEKKIQSNYCLIKNGQDLSWYLFVSGINRPCTKKLGPDGASTDCVTL
jgi:hypothetical protein